MKRRIRLRNLALTAVTCIAATVAAPVASAAPVAPASSVTPAVSAQASDPGQASVAAPTSATLMSSEFVDLPAVNVTVTPLDSAAIVGQARADASAVGIELPQVDSAVTDAINHSVNQFLPTSTRPAPVAEPAPAQPVLNDEASDPAGPSPVGERPLGEGPAAQPVADPVSELAPAPRPEPTPPLELAQAPGPAVGLVEEPSLTNPTPIGLGIDQEPLPVTTDQNYWWRNDPVSKVMAGKPFADYVLHRVPGSWFDAPRIPENSNQTMTEGASLYGPGTPIYVGDDALCTLTMAGTDSKGRKIGITAGHCGEVGDSVSSADSWQVGPSGTVVSKNEYLDYAVIELGSNAEVTNTYNGATAFAVGGQPQPGEIVCKQGVASNETCGMTLLTADDMQVNHVCSMVGDSGAPVFYQGRVVGMINGGVMPRPYNVECSTPLQGALHAPTASARMDAVVADMDSRGGVGAGFTLAKSK